MTHEYTLLVGATVLPGADAPPCEAIAWAGGVVLALGSEADIRAISRGDSAVLAYPGTFVVPIAGTLEVGAAADLVVLRVDPRQGDPGAPLARIRGGHLVNEEATAARQPG